MNILNMIIGGLQNFTISLTGRFPTWSSDVQNFGLMGLLMGPALQLSFSIRDDLRDDRSFHFSCWGFVRSGNSKTGSFDLCPCIDLKRRNKILTLCSSKHGNCVVAVPILAFFKKISYLFKQIRNFKMSLSLRNVQQSISLQNLRMWNR